MSAALQEDLRHRVASALRERLDAVASDAAALLPHSGDDRLDEESSARISRLLLQLLATVVHDGRADPTAARVTDLNRIALERGVDPPRVFAFAYLAERTALDELALDPALGAIAEHWPIVVQLVRRASFDMLAAYMVRTQSDAAGMTVVDRLTTVYSRPILDAAVGKEVERAARTGDVLSLVLVDVDNLAAINRDHGHSTGNRILERLGVLMRTYFRRHDWVARHGDDSIAVLLTRTTANNASELAERVRATVEERFGFEDHRSGQRVGVTVSVAAVNVSVSAGDVIDPERLMAEAEAAVARAKAAGKNRLERVDR